MKVTAEVGAAFDPRLSEIAGGRLGLSSPGSRSGLLLDVTFIFYQSLTISAFDATVYLARMKRPTIPIT